jgi:Icc protein
MPGNHDAANPMSRILGRNAISLESSVRCGKWNLVFLDSTIPGEEGGHLNRTQLEILGSSLAANSKAHTLVCLHHQPVPVGSPWLDTMALDNPEDFFSIVDRSPQVRAIIWGHVHQAFRAERGGVTLLGTPSTCVQFLPGTQGFALDTLTPGFRWLDLHSDGRIESGIRRIAAYPSPMDLTSGGY